MVSSSSSEYSAGQILAWGVAVGLGGAGVLWGLSQLLAVLVHALLVATATIVSATAVGITAAPWVAPVMATGVATIGAGTGYFVLVNLVEKAKKDIFTAALPVISIWAGAIVDLSKEAFGGNDVQKALYSILAGSLVLLSGVISQQKNYILKLLAIPLSLMSPLMFLALIYENHKTSYILSELRDKYLLDGAVLVVLAIISISVALWGSTKSSD